MRGYYNADVTYNYKYINGGASSSFEYTKQDSGSVTSYGGRIVITKYIDSDEATLNLNVLDPRIVGELIEPNAGLDIGLVPFFPVGGGMKVVGKSSKSFFDGAYYSDKVLGQIKKGDLHAFPEEVKLFESLGRTKTLRGGDGNIYYQLNIPGSYHGKNNWYDGSFEFIKDSYGEINHRFFRKE